MIISKESQKDIHEFLELEKSIKWFSKRSNCQKIIEQQQVELRVIQDKLKAQGIILE